MTTIVSGQNSPWGVAVTGSQLYWTNYGDNTVHEANLDGTGATAIATDPNFPQGVAVGPQ